MKLTWYRQKLRPQHRFATARRAIDEQETLVVELAGEGIVGRGEVVPAALYGQTPGSCEAALAGLAGLLGEDPFAIESIVGRLLEGFDGQRAAVAGVDSALHDWVGQRLGVPVWKLLRLERPWRQTSFTIGLGEPEETRLKVAAALAAGFEVLKVKVGGEQDEEALSLVREQFAGPLLLDANQAWAPRQAGGRIRELMRYRPTMIEQPLPKEDWRANAELRKLGLVPIFADESCERPRDLPRLAGCVDGVNIKFTKCGGICEALRMIAIARALGMQVMLGCFVSSSLAIAPALALASLADLVDLDGHLLLAEDPFAGIVRRGGSIGLGDSPGLGVRPARGD